MQLSLFSQPRFFLFLIAFISIGALGAAYIGEYFFELKPCVLCLYQRYAFMITTFAALLGTCLPTVKKQISMIFISAGLFFANFGLATYQVLVEKKILTLPAVCRGIDIDTQNQTFSQFQASLSKAGNHIPCDQISFELFGISMAGYNALFTLLSAFACLVIAVMLYGPLTQRKKGQCHGSK
tara:strand:+ start:1574 stop:2119 length:546 start_codon:yes stop_codon:yes gene_type:complete